MTLTDVFAGLPVADHDAARPWYERLLGREPDLVPNERESAWRFAGTSWIYVVDDPQRAGSGLLTVLVDDLDGMIAELAERGIDAGPVETVPGAFRRIAVTDPDGNRLAFGQPLS